jgi:spore germination protein GerM
LKSAPVLDVRLPAAQPWGINCKSNSLETSPLSSSDKLSNNIPVLVYLRERTEKAFVKQTVESASTPENQDMLIQQIEGHRTYYFKLT